MPRGVLFFLLFAATAFLPPAAAVAAPIAGSSTTGGIRFGDDTAGGFVDFVLPVVTAAKGIGFLNPRISLEDQGANEFNLGAGWRQLAFDDRVLLGGNLYFDSRHSEHGNRFNQLGVGVEVLSGWLDLRANYYLPEDDEELIASHETEMVEASVETTSRSNEGYGNPYAEANQIAQEYTLTTRTTITTTTTTTRRLFEQFESAMEGFDAEIGALLPLPPSFPSVRLFGGYYSFEDAFGNRVEGPKGRAEVRVGSFLSLDGEVFDDDELNGTSYYAGARFELPFDLAALFAGRSPFVAKGAPAQAALSSRMLEMVMRDPRVQTGESAFAENEAAILVEVAVEETSTKRSSTETFVLMDGVTFVDDDNAGGPENGTAENPYSQIQTGVDASGANPVVYVYAGEYSSVTLLPGVTLWGAGTPVQGYGGKQFGSGVYPRIAGASPAVTVTDNTRVTGFHITNTDDDGIVGEIDSGWVVIDNNVIGVSAGSDDIEANGIDLLTTNAAVTISGNTIVSNDGWGNGILLANSGNTAATIDGNTVLSDGSANWGVLVYNEQGTLTLDVTGNSIASDGYGLAVGSWGSGSSVTATVSGNTVSAWGAGMIFEILGEGIADPNALPVESSSGSSMTVVANGNTLTVGRDGMVFLNVGATMTTSVADNTITVSEAGGFGILVEDVLGSGAASLTGNTVSLGGASQLGIFAVSVESQSDWTVAGNDVIAAGSDTLGMYFLADESAVTLSASENVIVGGAATGMELFNYSGTFSVNAAAPGTGPDLAALNGGTGVFYSPDSASFVFLP